MHAGRRTEDNLQELHAQMALQRECKRADLPQLPQEDPEPILQETHEVSINVPWERKENKWGHGIF